MEKLLEKFLIDCEILRLNFLFCLKVLEHDFKSWEADVREVEFLAELSFNYLKRRRIRIFSQELV